MSFLQDMATGVGEGDPASQAAFAAGKKVAPEIPKISTQEEAERLAPGTTFLGPDDKQHVVPYKVEYPEQINSVPDGADFVGPDGKLRTKPKYEGVDYTAQTLYDMSVNDKERRRALERSYPGMVRDDPAGGFYVDDNGVLRKPGRGVERFTGAVSAAAAPTILSVLGAMGGGAAGTAVPGVGNVAGVAAGGAGGAVLGQGFNDVILGLTGVRDRSDTEEAAELGIAAAGGMAGAGVGRGIAGFVPSLRTGISALSAAAPGVMRSFLGAGEADLRMARELADKGVLVPPSAWAKESPHIHNLVEVFDPAFHTQKPLEQSAAAYYEKNAGALLHQLGVKDPGTLNKPIESVPTKEAGETIMRKTLGEMSAADAKMKEVLTQRQAGLAAGQGEATAQREALQKAADDSRAVAQKLIDQGYKDIQGDIDTAMRVAKAGHNSGDLWGAIGQKLIATRKAFGERAKIMYGQADQAAGGHLPNIEGLPDAAQAFLDQVPPDFQARYPNFVKKLRDLAGTKDEKTGEWIKEPHQPTFGELHNLRSEARANINWSDLTPDVREGSYKFFATKIDKILHDGEAAPELQEAARLLDETDKFYADNIKIYNSQQVKAVMRGLESGEPADPKNLYDVVVKSGQTDLTNRIKDMVGPNLWAGVKAADMQAMLDGSKTLTPGVIDGRKFATEVLARDRDGTLELVHGKEAAAKIREQAQRIEMLAGRLDIPVHPGDTATQVIARARQAEEVAKAAAKKDPIGTLGREMKKIEVDMRREAAVQRRKDPLGFLYKPTTGASEAVNRILDSEDLILAAAARFGEKSPEFEMLRQVWAQRFFTGTMQPSERLAKVSPEIQQIMFPGVTLNQMRTLAKEMDFLLNTRAMKGTAAGMAAMSKIEHPWGSGFLGKSVQTAGKLLGPASDASARFAHALFYKTIRDLVTSPVTLRWLEKGLNGTPAERELVRESIQAVLQKGGAVGAGVGEATVQSGGPR